MSVAQAAAEALAVVERARSLFVSSPDPTTPTGVALQTAGESVAGAGQRAADLSGELIDRHSEFVTEQTQRLSNAGRTDGALKSQLSGATVAMQAGARQMDAITAHTRAIAQAAATAQSPAAQRTVLAALRSQVAQANDVVNSTQRQAGDIAAQVRALNYGQAARSRPSASATATPSKRHLLRIRRTAKTRDTGSTSRRSSTFLKGSRHPTVTPRSDRICTTRIKTTR